MLYENEYEVQQEGQDQKDRMDRYVESVVQSYIADGLGRVAATEAAYAQIDAETQATVDLAEAERQAGKAVVATHFFNEAGLGLF